MNAKSPSTGLRPRMIQVALSVACIVASGTCTADMTEYDFRQPVKDGVILVGMECNRNSQSLEIGIFEGAYPPTKRMDLWRTSDLVTYDVQTNEVSDLRHVERTCNIGKDRYRVRFTGLPGAHNAMSQCGAIITATASIWKNGKLIYNHPLMRCSVAPAVRLARFVPGSSIPTIVEERQ